MIELLRRRAALLVLAMALALVAAACGGGDEPTEETGGGATGGGSESVTAGAPSEGEDAAASGGSFTVYLGEPQSLVASNTTESEGSQVLAALYAGLTAYDNETAEPLVGEESPNAVAESIETEDNKVFNITLKDGWTFHDGTPVTSSSFIDAWNYAAFQPNAQNGAYFFAPVDGYDDLQCPDEECAEDPPAMEMSGLEEVSETEFTVTLTEPAIYFRSAFGYTVFYPQPESFFEDPDAFNESPVGNGAFMMDGDWQHDVSISATKYEDYAGEPASADAVEFQIFDNPDTGYNEILANNLDIIDTVPPARIAGAESELGDRFIDQPSSVIQFLGFPTYDERFQNPDLRRAMSMAVPREQITEQIFSNTRVPAESFVSSLVPGARENPCGETCQFDPEAAKALYDSTEGLGDETLNMYFNSGGGHEEWVQAIANSWRDTFGLADGQIQFQSLDFAEYLQLLEDKQVDGPYRLGWLFDYPSIQNYLGPLYKTGASSNYTFYSNPEFDGLLDEAAAAETNEESLELYQQAEDILLDDMPAIPVMFSNTTAAYSENVDNVIFDIFGQVVLNEVTVNE
jgi:ABC-type oligopeptide transport system substrate-binding subunit